MPATITAFKDASAAVLTKRTPQRLAEILARMFFNEYRTHDDLLVLLQQLGDAMAKDGAGDVFGKALAEKKVREVAGRRLAARLLQT